MSQDLNKYVRSPMTNTDLRPYLNNELAKIQAATDTFFTLLGAINMLAGYLEGEAILSIVGSTTPGVATYTGQKFRWSKIGRLVLLTGALQWTGHTGTGNMRVTGLPFPVDALFSGMPVFLIGVGGVPSTTTGFINSAFTGIDVQTAGGAGAQAMTATGDIRITSAYYSNT